MTTKEQVLNRYRDDSRFQDNKSVLFTKQDALASMDEWAEIKSKEVAISFGKWCSNNKYEYMGDEQWINYDGDTVFSDDLYKYFIDDLKQQSND